MKKSGRAAFSRFLFLLYCGAMFWLLFGQRWGEDSYLAQQGMNINLTPLHTIRQYIGLLQNDTYRFHAVVNLFGNVLMFVPPGFLLPRIWRRFHSFWRTMLVMLLAIIAVELLQYITGLGSCDIDDLILNMSGIVAGYIYWKIRTPKRR